MNPAAAQLDFSFMLLNIFVGLYLLPPITQLQHLCDFSRCIVYIFDVW